MSTKKYLIKSLVACEKPEFDKVIKTYLREIYGYNKIVLTDGTGDVGMDIKVFDTGTEKVQYQLTTQMSETAAEKKAFERKILADIEKAKINFTDYNYSNILFFFYSHPLTNKVIREYEKSALVNYGINLSLIDANRIAEESEEYLELQHAIVNTNEILDIQLNDKVFPDSEKNLIFDLVGFGKSSDFKLQIVESYILQKLLSYGSTSYGDIVSFCKEKFQGGENEIFFQKLIQRLQTARKIKKDPSGNFRLSDDESNRLATLLDQYNLNENRFIVEIKAILSKYGQETHLEAYIDQLKEIYIKNFNSNIIEFLENLKENDLAGISRDFLNFIKGLYEGNAEEIKSIAKELFQYCEKDDFLQKFCAGKVFGEAANLSRIEKYVNTQKRIFIDTQIAIYSLCYFYQPKAEYKNHFFTTTRSLLNFCKQNKLLLHLPDRYLWEVQTHVSDAINLIPFTELPNFTKLGTSRNVFYNFYLFLKAENHHIGSFANFLSTFNFRIGDRRRNTLVISEHLKNLGLKIHTLTKNYDITETSQIIEENLVVLGRTKTNFGLSNDAIIMEFLSDSDVEINPLQPIFLTWDKTFFNIKNEFFTKNPTYQRWFLLSPGRFIDQYSLLQFSINSEVLTSEMIAYLSDDIVKSTHSLLDTITFVFSGSDVSLEYVNKLAEIRDNEIHRIQEMEVIPPADLDGPVVIDDIFYKLTKHFSESDKGIADFKKLFNQKELIDQVIITIQNAIEKIYENSRVDYAIFKQFEGLIEKMNSK